MEIPEEWGGRVEKPAPPKEREDHYRRQQHRPTLVHNSVNIKLHQAIVAAVSPQQTKKPLENIRGLSDDRHPQQQPEEICAPANMRKMII